MTAPQITASDHITITAKMTTAQITAVRSHHESQLYDDTLNAPMTPQIAVYDHTTNDGTSNAAMTHPIPPSHHH